MEDESTAASAMTNWITKLSTRITSGKIVPVHYGDHVPPTVSEAVRSARAMWIVGLSNSTFEIDGLFANCEGRKGALPSPAHTKRRMIFPCPVHNGMSSEAQTHVIRRSKLSGSWGLEVRWVDHENLQPMIIINPPIEHDPDLGDGLALIDLSLPNTTALAKFEITQKDHSKTFSDLVRSFSHIWGTAHEPAYEETRNTVKRVLLLDRELLLA